MSSDPNSELFIGLVGAVGTDLKLVCDQLEGELRQYAYDPQELHLSNYLAEVEWKVELEDEFFDLRVATRMSAGTKLRQAWNRGDALALLAMEKVSAARREVEEAQAAAQDSGDSSDDAQPEAGGDDDSLGLPPSLERTAFILNSLKTPEEVETLRAVYGPRFVLIAAYSPEEARRRSLESQIRDSRGAGTPEVTASDLMQRDEREDEARGQNVRDTFYRADFFVNAQEQDRLREDLVRIVSIIFGDPFRTPNKAEYALFSAEGAARRSAEPGRQVGAAIATKAGSIVALGTNEVPAPKGGLYWEGDDPDGREFAHERCEHDDELDTNTRRQREIAEAIGAELVRRKLVDAESADVEKLREAIMATELGDITEFGRAVHAEMAALLDAAARGVSVQGTVLYTTTFPCHNCARHIVGAGITRMVYVAPYAKSKAFDLHSDAIDHGKIELSEHKVHFEPFVGVAPRRYLSYFDASLKDERDEHLSRKGDDDKLATFDPRKAVPLFTDLEPKDLQPGRAPYRVRESRAMNLLVETIDDKKDTLREVTLDG